MARRSSTLRVFAVASAMSIVVSGIVPTSAHAVSAQNVASAGMNAPAAVPSSIDSRTVAPTQPKNPLKAYGLPPRPGGFPKLSRKGVVTIPVSVQAYKNQARKKKAHRHLGSSQDKLTVNLTVVKSNGQPTYGAVTRDRVQFSAKRAVKIKRDGIATFAFKLPKKLAKKLPKLKSKGLAKRIKINIEQRKDVKQGRPDRETIFGSSVSAELFSKVKRSSKRAFKFKPAKKQGVYLTAEMKKKKRPATRSTYTQGGSGLWSNSFTQYETYDVSTQEIATDPSAQCQTNNVTEQCAYLWSSGITIVNNSPFTMGLTYAPLSCAIATPTPAVTGDAPTSIPPNGQYIDAYFTPLDGNVVSGSEGGFTNAGVNELGGVAQANTQGSMTSALDAIGTATGGAADKAYDEFSDMDNDYTPNSSGALALGTGGEAAVAGLTALAFIKSFIVDWDADSCDKADISQLWSITAVATGLPGGVAAGGPNQWNYSGQATNTTTNQVVPLGAGQQPIPSNWAAPSAAYTQSHIGLSTSATWNWQNGAPNNGPNPYLPTSSENQAGSVQNQGAFVQSADIATGTVYISYLGNDFATFGPYPAGAADALQSQMQLDAGPGGVNNPGGIDLTCRAGDWNLTSPWTPSNEGLTFTQNFKDIVATNSNSVSEAAQVGFTFTFVGFDADGNALYSDDFGPQTNSPGLGGNALPQFVPVALGNQASASMSASDLANLMYADGTPYTGGLPSSYGCTVIGSTTLPQGSSFNSTLGSVSAFKNNNSMWQSSPYTVTKSILDGPQMITAPTLSSTLPTSSTGVTVNPGTWKHARHTTVVWYACGSSPTCSGTPLGVLGTGETLPIPSGPPTSTLLYSGYYFYAAVSVQSANGMIQTVRSPVGQFNTPPTLNQGPTFECTDQNVCTASAEWIGLNPMNFVYTYELTNCANELSPSCDWIAFQDDYPTVDGNSGVVTDTVTIPGNTQVQNPTFIRVGMVGVSGTGQISQQTFSAAAPVQP